MILVQVAMSGLLLGAIYALFSSGLTLIWGMMNVVNFAHGDFVMIGVYIAYWTFVLTHLGPGPFSILAALGLALLGVIVYLTMIRQVMRGPMLAQILGTFGLGLFLKYACFWAFSANFVTLPDKLVGGTFNVGGILLGAPQLLAGSVALVLTLGMHMLLTRTLLGSQMLAVSEDRQAAMLMGIRPDR